MELLPKENFTMNRKQYFKQPTVASKTAAEKERLYKRYLSRLAGNGGGGRPGTTVHHPLNLGLHAMSACGAHYLQALTHPFSLKKAPCIPDLHGVPSKKNKIITRLSFSTGENGSGFILYNPQDKCNDVSSNSAIVYTNSAYLGTVSTPVATSGTGIATAREAKIPYASTQFEASTQTPGVQGRIVGCGMRIRYAGTELNRGGTVNAIRHPDNQTLVGLVSDDIRSYETCAVFPVSREWQTICYRPVRPDEFEYSPYPVGSFPANPTTPGAGAQLFPMGFVINGTSAASGSVAAPFEAEFVKFIEYIGNVDNVTRTHTDVSSMSLIRNILPTKSAHRDMHKELGNALARAGTYALKQAPPYVAKQLLKSAEGESEGFLDMITNGVKSFAGDAIKEVIGNGIFDIAKMLL